MAITGRKILVSDRPDLGRKTYMTDLGNGYTQITVEEDMTDVFEQNKAEFNDSEGKRWDSGRIAARIPLSLYYDPNLGYAKAKAEGDEKHIKKILNNSDYRNLRTWKGTI